LRIKSFCLVATFQTQLDALTSRSEWLTGSNGLAAISASLDSTLFQNSTNFTLTVVNLASNYLYGQIRGRWRHRRSGHQHFRKSLHAIKRRLQRVHRPAQHGQQRALHGPSPRRATAFRPRLPAQILASNLVGTAQLNNASNAPGDIDQQPVDRYQPGSRSVGAHLPTAHQWQGDVSDEHGLARIAFPPMDRRDHVSASPSGGLFAFAHQHRGQQTGHHHELRPLLDRQIWRPTRRHCSASSITGHAPLRST